MKGNKIKHFRDAKPGDVIRAVDKISSIDELWVGLVAEYIPENTPNSFYGEDAGVTAYYLEDSPFGPLSHSVDPNEEIEILEGIERMKIIHLILREQNERVNDIIKEIVEIEGLM